MAEAAPILLFVGDRPVLSSLEFALALDGFAVAEGPIGAGDLPAAACLVVDQDYEDDGMAFLMGLRQRGCTTPAIVLVTHPTLATRILATAIGAMLIEKPLLGEDLTQALREAPIFCRNKGFVA
jgi:FixJ family two-component response regulator